MEERIVVLDAGTFYGFPDFENSLAGLGELKLYETTSLNEVSDRIANATVVLTNKVLLTRETLQKATSLKLVCVTATGMNNIDLEVASELNILVKNAKNYSTDSVAQTTFAMALHLLMRLGDHHDYVLSGYTDHRFFTHLQPGFSELSGKTWGIIGLGSIGRKVAEIAKAFGCHVIYHSASGQNNQPGYEHQNLRDLLSNSDIISIHTPLNDYTYNLLTYNNLRYCKKSVVLINVARGGIVDEEGLKQVLEEGLISGVATDVYSTEPIRQDNPLLSIKDKNKILLTPHIAWGSFEARHKLMDITRQNIVDYLSAGK